jgi:hypothetical protein
MGQVVVDMSMSLDCFVAGPNRSFWRTAGGASKTSVRRWPSRARE